MPYERIKPSMKGLYAAYKANVDLNKYVLLKELYKSHNAVMAIVSDHEISRLQIDDALNLGVTTAEIGQTFIEHVNLTCYISARRATRFGVDVSHAQAVEVANLGIISYLTVVQLSKISHEQVLAFYSEFRGEAVDFDRYCSARIQGASVEVSRMFSAQHLLSGYHLQKANKAKVSAEDLLDAANYYDYDDESIIEKVYGYLDLRAAAHNDGFVISHEEAIEAAKMQWPNSYLEARREGGNHKQAKTRAISYYLDLKFGRF